MGLTIGDKKVAYFIAKLPLKTKEFEAHVKRITESITP